MVRPTDLLRLPAFLLSLVLFLTGLPAGGVLQPIAAQDSPRITALGKSTDQESPPADDPEPETAVEAVAEGPVQQLRGQLRAAETLAADADLEEGRRKQIAEQITQALQDLTAAEDLRQRNEDLQTHIEELSQEAQKLAGSPVSSPPPMVGTMAMAEIETQVAELRVTLTTEQQKLEGLQEAAEQLAKRKVELQQLLQTLEAELASAKEKMEQLAGHDNDAQRRLDYLATHAQRLQRNAARDLTRTRLADLEAELALKLPALRVQQGERRVTQLRAHLQLLQAELEQRRQQASQQKLEQARAAESDLDHVQNQVVRDLGQQRVQLAETNDRFVQQIASWKTRLEVRSQRRDQLTTEAGRIRKQVRKFGTGRTVGRRLLLFAEELEDTAISGQDAPGRPEHTIEQEMEQIDELTLQAEDDLGTVRQLRDQVRTLQAAAGEDQQADLRVLSSVEELLAELETNARQLIHVLGEVDGTDQSLLLFREDWESFVRAEALWLRSHDPLAPEDVLAAPDRFQSLCRSVIRSLIGQSQLNRWRFWALCLPAAAAIGLLFAVQNRAKRRLLAQGEIAEARTCQSLKPTWWAILLSFGLAAEWPLLLILIGTTLAHRAEGAAASCGLALEQLGAVALWLNFSRQVLRPGGLASHHFSWNQVVCDRLRRWLRAVLIVLSLPMLLFLLARHTESDHDTTERLAFCLLMACTALLLGRLLYPLGSPFVQTLTRQSGFLRSTRRFWSALLVLSPLSFIVCSVSGFHHTALVLCQRFGLTLITGTVVLLCWSFVLRWLRVNHRRTRLALARERAQEKEQIDDASEMNLRSQAEADDADLFTLSTQARQLVRNAAVLMMIGCAWSIWVDVFPAFQILDQFKCWSIHEQVLTYVTGDDGNVVEQTAIQVRDVTLKSLLVVLFVATATWIGVRQLPGLIEVLLLPRLSLDKGVRYAITTVCRYVLLFVGTSLVFHFLGLRWSQVQWLAAGLTVGLGFGLQEIFANFISGIIILAERPIRIGDVVTIDGVSGVVSRIRIRATSITDWDRREYIVPNRELVTGKLLNWTLSDSTNRVVLRVGISYDCDPGLARDLLLQIARDHSNVLDDPGPIATFESFGDSSLDLVLRAYLPDMDNRLGTITELHSEIHRVFAEQGISIPFPQREVRML